MEKMLPGIGDYEEPQEEKTYEEWLEEWYAFNEDRSDGWDCTEDW